MAHLVQAVYFTVRTAQLDSEAYEWPVTYPGYNKILDQHTQYYKLGRLVPVFSYLSAVNHIASVAFPAYYDIVLSNRVNILRWVEFSVSASAMIVMLATMSGVTELRTIISLVILNVGMQMMGLLVEQRKAAGASRGELIYLTAIGWTFFAASWVQIIMSFVTVAEWDGATKPPPIVYAIISTMVTLFASFGALQIAYIFDLVDFTSYEAGFIGLSLAAKSMLAFMTFFGVLAAKKRFEPA